MFQAFPADRHITLDLAIQDLFNILNFYFIRKLQNIFHCEKLFVTCLMTIFLICLSLFQNTHPIFFHPGDIFMGLLNLDQRRMLSGAQFHYNVKSRHAFDQFTGTKFLI